MVEEAGRDQHRLSPRNDSQLGRWMSTMLLGRPIQDSWKPASSTAPPLAYQRHASIRFTSSIELIRSSGIYTGLHSALLGISIPVALFCSQCMFLTLVHSDGTSAPCFRVFWQQVLSSSLRA